MFKVGDEIVIPIKVVEVDLEGECCRVEFKDGSCSWYSNVYIDRAKGETYTQGLADAWELAKKILEMCGEKREEILGLGSYANILEFVAPQEALAKIEAYKKEKEIKVGDVVVKTSGAGSKYIGVVTQITDAQYSVCLVFSDGSTETTIANNLTKTGKHIDIESLLQQIGE